MFKWAGFLFCKKLFCLLLYSLVLRSSITSLKHVHFDTSFIIDSFFVEGVFLTNASALLSAVVKSELDQYIRVPCPRTLHTHLIWCWRLAVRLLRIHLDTFPSICVCMVSLLPMISAFTCLLYFSWMLGKSIALSISNSLPTSIVTISIAFAWASSTDSTIFDVGT